MKIPLCKGTERRPCSHLKRIGSEIQARTFNYDRCIVVIIIVVFIITFIIKLLLSIGEYH